MRRALALAALAALALSCQRTGPEVTALPPGQPPQGRCPDAPASLIVDQMQLQLDGPLITVLHEHLRWLEEHEVGDRWDFPTEFDELQPGDPLPEGVTDNNAPVWVLGDGEPCRMTLGARMRVRLSQGGAPYEVLVRRLEGSCALPNSGAIALQQEEAPGACHYAPMKPLDDPRAAPFALPAAAFQALSPDTCAPPGCYIERHFEADALSDGAQVVGVNGVRYNVDANGQPDCGTVELLDMAWFRPRADAPWQEWPRGYEGRHLLYDDRGLRALVHQRYGVLHLDAPTSPEVTALYDTRWAIYNDEDTGNELNPCGL
jgi:hypothetical protein